jgi:small-conductance mechanosensitive channel
VTGFGAFSVSLAFALKESAGNALSGAMLLLGRPFNTGDTIKVHAAGVEGKVVALDLRYLHLEVAKESPGFANPQVGKAGPTVVMVPCSVVQGSTITRIRRG